MSTQQVRPSSKWNVVRSRAVPSNVMPPASSSSLKPLNSQQLGSGQIDAIGNLNKAGKSIGSKAALPHRQDKPAAFSGSTGQQHP